MTQLFKKQWRNIAVIAILLAASIISTGFIAIRRAVSGDWTHYFLVWNLFLAWIPLGIAFLLRLMRRPPLALLLVGGVIWMAFLPNAPYLLTDLIHFRWSRSMLWLDWSMFLSFALTGLFAGYASLVWMQAIVRDRWGVAAGRLLAITALIGSGAGVYIGRFLRWNSWDIVTRPDELVLNIFNQYFSAETFVHTWALSIIFALLFAFCFSMVNLLSAENSPPSAPSHRFASGD